MLVWFAACAPPPVDVEPTVPRPQLARHAGSLDWRACPPSLPASCRMTVLEGDPSVAGQLFTTRLRVPEAFALPPHTHPANERLTVLEGDVHVSFGPTRKPNASRDFGPLDYYVTARGEPHAVWSDAGAMVQITGIGPWKVEPVE
ncbi:MAG: cupin domain-containing protein [Myxococcota bacterium]